MPRLTIDQAQRCVRLEEREIRLSPQLYRVLLYLAQRSEEVVSKEDLMEAMWPEIDNENAWTCRGDPSAIDLVDRRARLRRQIKLPGSSSL